MNGKGSYSERAVNRIRQRNLDHYGDTTLLYGVHYDRQESSDRMDFV